MVVTPAYVKRLAEERKKPPVRAVEKSIDDLLSNGTHVHTHHVSEYFLAPLPASSQEKLLDKYRAHGWDVQYNHSIYDGSFYQFKMNETKKLIDDESEHNSYMRVV